MSLSSQRNAVCRRLASAIDSPRSIPRVLAMVATKAFWLARQRRFGELLGFLATFLFGRNVYYDRVVGDRSDDAIERDIHDHRMYLAPNQGGISRTLLSYGTHEHLSTTIFETELERLRRETTGEITVLEIGANIGYFSLIEANALGERATIHAIEPAPENLSLLERNVSLNDYEDVIDITHGAIGDTIEPVDLRLSRSSNWHTVEPSARSIGSVHGDAVDRGARLHTNSSDSRTVPISQTTVEAFLAERGRSPADANVIRMDVEGYEIAIFEGMERVLEASTPLVLHMEFHLNRLDARSADRIATALAENGFELVSAVNESGADIGDELNWYGRRLDVETFDELLAVAAGQWVEVIARR